MTQAGFFIRGAITEGPLFIDSNMIFGEPLIEAYTLESSIAITPRIILSTKIMTRLNRYNKYYNENSMKSSLQKFILKDNDGQFFINYLLGITSLPILKKYNKIIKQNINKNKNNAHILEKYLWLARYHNNHCNLAVPGNSSLCININKSPNNITSSNY